MEWENVYEKKKHKHTHRHPYIRESNECLHNWITEQRPKRYTHMDQEFLQ